MSEIIERVVFGLGFLRVGCTRPIVFVNLVLYPHKTAKIIKTLWRTRGRENVIPVNFG